MVLPVVPDDVPVDVKAWVMVGSDGHAYNLRWPSSSDDPDALRGAGYEPLVVAEERNPFNLTERDQWAYSLGYKVGFDAATDDITSVGSASVERLVRRLAAALESTHYPSLCRSTGPTSAGMPCEPCAVLDAVERAYPTEESPGGQA